MKIGNKALFIIFTLFILLGIASAVFLSQKTQITTKKTAPATQLSLVGDKAARLSEEYNLSVNMETGENNVVGAELYIDYDPEFLEPTAVSKGAFMQSADVIGPRIESGEIFYTLIVKPNDTPVTGSGTIAQITFKTLKTGNTNISLNEGKTLAVAVGEGSVNVITKYSPLSLNIYNTFVSLRLSPDKSGYNVGDEVIIYAWVNSGGVDLVGIEMFIKYDSNMLRFEKADALDYFQNPDIVGPNVNTEAGTIHYTQILPPENHNTKEQGNIAAFTFTALKSGQSSLSFINQQTIAVAYGQGQQNVLKEAFPAEVFVSGATASPGPSLSPSSTPGGVIPGDINRDGKVDILDYTLLLEYFSEESSAYPNADLNADGKINLLDYIVLFENFGASS